MGGQSIISWCDVILAAFDHIHCLFIGHLLASRACCASQPRIFSTFVYTWGEIRCSCAASDHVRHLLGLRLRSKPGVWRTDLLASLACSAPQPPFKFMFVNTWGEMRCSYAASDHICHLLGLRLRRQPNV